MLKATSSPTDSSPSITALAPNSSRAGGRELAHILDRDLAARPDQASVEGGGDIGRELLLPLHLHRGLDGRRLDRLHADDRLDQHLLALCAAIELLLDRLAQNRAHQRGDEEIERDRHHDDERQLPGIGKQHRDEDDGEKDIERREQTLAGEEGADRLELAHARHGLAGRARLEIAHRQMEQMEEQPPAELDVDAVRRMRERIGAQILQHDVEEADDTRPADQHEKRVVALVAEHLVDDDLEKQRRHQREDLHEEGGEQNMRERAPVAPDRRQEPFQPKVCGSTPAPPSLRETRMAVLVSAESSSRLTARSRRLKGLTRR